jgi:hypothetical protein
MEILPIWFTVRPVRADVVDSSRRRPWIGRDEESPVGSADGDEASRPTVGSRIAIRARRP